MVRIIYLAIAIVSWIATSAWRRRSMSPLVLCYHGVTRRQRDRFRRQMEIVARTNRGLVEITFDDAFRNVIDNALPITRELDIPVTVFAVSDVMGHIPNWSIARDHVDANEVTMGPEELLAATAVCTVGSHTRTHRDLTACSRADAREELVSSRIQLESVLGRSVSAFAFPHGGYDASLLEDAFAAGYERVYTLDATTTNVSDPTRAIIGRMSMSPDAWMVECRLTVAGAYAWLPWVRRYVRRFKSLPIARRAEPQRVEHVDLARSPGRVGGQRAEEAGSLQIAPPGGEREELMIRTLFPVPWNDGGIGHTASSICRHLQGEGVRTELLVPSVRGRSCPSHVRTLLPGPLRPLPFRCMQPWASRLVERAFRRAVRPGEVAYLFSCVSLECVRALHRDGVPIIREKFNCHTATARRILGDAYERIGVSPAHGITCRQIEQEQEGLALADAVFSPSPLVTQSLVDAGVEVSKIIESSYGWDPARLAGTHRHLSPIDGTTVLFVGSICVRKGAHLLLQAWAQARVHGRLVLCGDVEPAIRERFSHLLERPDIQMLGHVADVGAVYRSADLLALPTLEEGSPLVVYEGMGTGLPMLVSPMGGGAVVRNGEDGLVLDPYDTDAWAEALRRLAGDGELRAAYAAAARDRAQWFTWNRVGARRRAMLLQYLADTGQGIPQRGDHAQRLAA